MAFKVENLIQLLSLILIESICNFESLLIVILLKDYFATSIFTNTRSFFKLLGGYPGLNNLSSLYEIWASSDVLPQL